MESENPYEATITPAVPTAEVAEQLTYGEKVRKSTWYALRMTLLLLGPLAALLGIFMLGAGIATGRLNEPMLVTELLSLPLWVGAIALPVVALAIAVFNVEVVAVVAVSAIHFVQAVLARFNKNVSTH